VASDIIDIDHGWDKLLQTLLKEESVSVDVGIFEGPRVEVAIAAEYGNGHEPERSFLRSTFDAHDAYSEKTRELVAEIVKGAITPHEAIETLGQTFVADIKEQITSGQITPPDSYSTIERKGSSIPLIDTHELVNSIKLRHGEK